MAWARAAGLILHPGDCVTATEPLAHLRAPFSVGALGVAGPAQSWQRRQRDLYQMSLLHAREEVCLTSRPPSGRVFVPGYVPGGRAQAQQSSLRRLARLLDNPGRRRRQASSSTPVAAADALEHTMTRCWPVPMCLTTGVIEMVCDRGAGSSDARERGDRSGAKRRGHHPRPKQNPTRPPCTAYPGLEASAGPASVVRGQRSHWRASCRAFRNDLFELPRPQWCSDDAKDHGVALQGLIIPIPARTRRGAKGAPWPLGKGSYWPSGGCQTGPAADFAARMRRCHF